MGNNAPPVIRQIEELLFDGLLSIAQGQKTSREVLNDIMVEIPWNDLDSLDDTVTGWFSVGKFS